MVSFIKTLDLDFTINKSYMQIIVLNLKVGYINLAYLQSSIFWADVIGILQLHASNSTFPE